MLRLTNTRTRTIGHPTVSAIVITNITIAETEVTIGLTGVMVILGQSRIATAIVAAAMADTATTTNPAHGVDNERHDEMI